MNILISGGSGFIGQALSHYLQGDRNTSNHSSTQNTSANITWLTRDINQPHPDSVSLMSYEQLKTTEATFDVIINLAGAGIADKRWSDERKQLLMQSRLKPTQALLDYIERIANKPKLLLSGSAVGWYGAQGDKTLDETSGFVDDFAHQICASWEDQASLATQFGVPVALVRTGIVIHPKGGMIAKLLTPFKMGVGGQLGSGEQIMSWISLQDWVRAAILVIEEQLNQTPKAVENVRIYNFTSPTPVSNKQFTKQLGDWLNRPTLMTLPEWLLKLMFGEMATLLIDGQKVLPTTLLDLGFEFKHETIQQALQQQS